MVDINKHEGVLLVSGLPEMFSACWEYRENVFFGKECLVSVLLSLISFVCCLLCKLNVSPVGLYVEHVSFLSFLSFLFLLYVRKKTDWCLY